MKNLMYLIRLFFISFFLLLPSFSFAQGLAPIPDVGEGVCVFNCPGDAPIVPPSPEPTLTPTPTPVIESEPITQSHLESAKELNIQALEELNEGNYIEAKGTINSTIESLNNAKDNLRTDPVILELCGSKPKAINKIERIIQLSINNHNKAASAVDQIIDITSTTNRTNNNSTENREEELLQKLLRFAKRLLKKPIRVSNSFAVCGVRG